MCLVLVFKVLMIGGTSKIPIVQRTLEKKLGLNSVRKDGTKFTMIDTNDDRQLMVVKGGAVLGGYMAYDKQPIADDDDIVVKVDEVLPMSYGVEYCQNDPNEPDGVKCNLMDILLRKGSKYGTKGESEYCQRYPNGNKAELKLFEGDSLDTRDNFYLGELEIFDVPPRKRGECHNIEVELGIDSNGIIKIKAFTVDLRNNIKEYSHELEIKSNDGSLNDEGIDKLRVETLSWSISI